MNLSNEIAFHLSDACNLRCKDCHWFSQPIKPASKIIQVGEYLECIKRLRPEVVRLTGGEPFLYPYLEELLSEIPSEIKVNLFSNGTLLNSQNLPRRSNLRLFISDNDKLDKQQLLPLLEEFPQVTFISFLPEKEADITLKNQLKEGKLLDALLHLNVVCSPTMLRFGTDGHAYYCECGLRSKDPDLRIPITLSEGVVDGFPKKFCKVQESCLSNFVYEQKVRPRHREE